MDACASLPNCGFAKKYSDNLEIRDFITKYCHTEMQNECKRKEYKMKNGTPPPDDMLPNGAMIQE